MARKKNTPPVPVPAPAPEAPAAPTPTLAEVEALRIGIQSRIHEGDFTQHVSEGHSAEEDGAWKFKRLEGISPIDEAPPAAAPAKLDERATAFKALREVLESKTASITARLDAAEVLGKHGMLPYEVLVVLAEPPSDPRERVRAAKLLLGM